MNAIRLLLLAGVVLLFAQSASLGQVKDEQIRADEKYLRDGGIPLDDKSLIKLIADFTGPGRDPEKIPALIKDLESPVFKMRKQAKDGLIKMGTRAAPSLRKLKDSPDPEISRWAKKALEEVEIRTYRYVCAVRLLAKRGAREAMPVLWDALEDPEGRVVHTAEEGLADLLQSDELPVLKNALKDKRVPVRVAAVKLLWKYEKDHPKEVAAIAMQVLRNDRSVLVRQRALTPLGHLAFAKQEGVIEPMIAALEDQEEFGQGSVASWAAVELGAVGERKALPRLLKLVDSRNDYLAGNALWGLRLMLDKHKSVIPDILPVCEKVLLDKKKPLRPRSNAVSCLGRMDQRAVPALIKVVKEDPKIRGHALRCLGELGPNGGKAIPDIIRVMVDAKETTNNRAAAIQALGDIGPAAQDAAPILERGFNEPALDYWARMSLKKINTKP
jgi:HEAT repeat protein